jgi:hypothetical protein
VKSNQSSSVIVHADMDMTGWILLTLSAVAVLGFAWAALGERKRN